MTTKTTHITDLFFRAEIARAAGSDACEKWISQQAAATLPSSGFYFPRTYRDLPVPNSYRRCENPQPYIGICLKSEYNHLFSGLGIDADKEQGDRIGLQFTDAAHTLLWQPSCSGMVSDAAY